MCRGEVEDLSRFRGEMAVTPIRRRPARWSSRWPSRWLGYAAIAAGVVVAAGLGVRSLLHLPGAALPVAVGPAPVARPQSPEPPLAAEELAAMELARSTHQMPRAAVLGRLIGQRGVLLGAASEAKTFEVAAPVGTVVLGDRPTFRWQAMGGAKQYVVAVFDENFEKVAGSAPVAGTEWQPEAPLPRGRMYIWQVSAQMGNRTVRAPQPPAPEARFEIAGADAAGALDTARRLHPGNHLLLAVLLAKAGALDDAARELDALGATDGAMAESLRGSLELQRKR
jgi:hypothetical protein